MTLLSLFKTKRKRSRRSYLIAQLDAITSRKVRERDGHRCRKCGRERVYHHHIFTKTRLSTRWIKENGVTLCFHCHRWAHASGEVVYVKETWAVVEVAGQGIGNQYVIYDDEWVHGEPKPKELRPTFGMQFGPHSAIYMPEWASRLHLKILSVRAERVQEITEEEARREGFQTTFICPRDEFRDVRNTLQPGSWKRNDWAWRMEFARILKGEEVDHD